MSNVTLPPLWWAPSPNQSARLHTPGVHGIIWHETEGPFASAVSWFAQSRSQVSAHLVLAEDGSKAAQCVAFSRKAWHACNANDYTIGIELAGVQPQTLQPAQIARLCRITAYLCHRFGIPARWAGDNHGFGGIATHKSLGAFGGNHGDPGGFDLEAAIRQVGVELARGGFRPSWGRD